MNADLHTWLKVHCKYKPNALPVKKLLSGVSVRVKNLDRSRDLEREEEEEEDEEEEEEEDFRFFFFCFRSPLPRFLKGRIL